MRSYPADYDLVAPGNLDSVLRLLHDEAGQWTPIAGGTEIMVLYGAGKLAARKLVSISLPDLSQIVDDGDSISIGGGCSFTQIRHHSGIQKHFPLLAQCAAWTGGIANQNRGTIGGNEQFHLGYKKTALASDELIRGVVLPKRFEKALRYGRKVGSRNAQAISKICVAATASFRHGRVEEIRIGMGSVAPTPLRLLRTEQVLLGATPNAATIAEARRVLSSESAPIDDIRSTASYRALVAGNLLEEMLRVFAGASR
jgi:CO/xanthine dehydrogenase FAD-binding subunit